MSTWTPLDAAIWTMGQLAWPAFILAGLIVLLSLVLHDKRLLFFLLPLSVSEALLFSAGIFERRLDDTTWLTMAFLAVQAGLVVFGARMSKGQQWALFVGALCFIYSVVASIVAGMGFTGDWS